MTTGSYKWGIRDWLQGFGGCLVFVGIISATWAGQLYLDRRPVVPKLTPSEMLAIDASGEWESFGGRITMNLGEKGIATFSRDVSDNKSNDSVGSWRAKDKTIEVHANGAAGQFDLALEYTQGGEVEALSPIPKSSALVTSCYFRKADADSDENWQSDADDYQANNSD